MATKSLAKLKAQRQQTQGSQAPEAGRAGNQDSAATPAHRRKKPYDEVHITVYGPIEGKTALEELCIARKKELGRKVTLRELAFEAFNDILKKYGKPPIFPDEGAH